MPTPFGPQLIGETEKTLGALLDRVLASAVSDRAHVPDAADLVSDLTTRGLLDDGRPSASARALVARAQSKIAADAGPIFDGLDPTDVAAAERLLNEVGRRARAVLSSA